MSRLSKLARRLALLLLLLLALACLGAWIAVRGSLASLDGNLPLRGLAAPVSVQRDALGTVTISASSEIDAARALGFIHGQERFFEMDLLRRSAAGELSELFGAIAIDKDKSIRVHRLRERARGELAVVAGDRQAVLDAYTAGVNAGLGALRSRPWPYLLLGLHPRAWEPVDTALVGYAMFFDLQDESNSRELALYRISRSIPAALYRLIAADGTAWDAPLIGAARGDVSLPSASELDLRKLPGAPAAGSRESAEPAAPGSNNFAVAGGLTADHRAIVANDMHLGLRVPNIWFRARLLYPDPQAQGGQVDVSGFTLPGTPAIVVGSNRHVAWGFTNAYGDWLDFYQVQWLDAAHTRYRTARGEASVARIVETIRVKGAAPVTLQVRDTIWGPVTVDEDNGTSLALRWTAHEPGSLNLALSAMATATDVDSALQRAGQIGMPAQNLLVADSSGRIAWRLTAQMPARTGNCNPKAPIDPLACDWHGWLAAAENPSLPDPPSQRLWTANARTVDGRGLELIGDAGYANGARARQIRNALFARERFDEHALMAIQLDDRALFLQRWWALLRRQATAGSDPAWKSIEASTRRWEGRATPASVSYRIVREYRLAVVDRVREGLLAPAMAALGEDFVMPDLPQIEGVAWQLASQRPANLLPKRFASWDALFLDAARSVLDGLPASTDGAARSWGARNSAAICHPLAKALPALLRAALCMPADALPGDMNMPRVASPAFGASERMVVAPGHEEDGIIHMPGGQSDNPLSPFWGAGHEDWVHGRPTHFLPGPATHRLALQPR